MCRFALVVLVSFLLMSCSAVGHRPDIPTVGSIPLVTFVLDDGNDTDYLVGKKIFAAQGAVACSAITTDRINTPYHLTPAQIIALQKAGWEIMDHTVSHPNLNSLTTPRLEDELLRSKKILEGMGLTVNNLVYPFNKNNETVRSIVRKYYRSGRGGTNSFNLGQFDPYFLKSFALKHDLPLMESHIDQAYRDKSWLIFYTHEIDAKVKITDSHGIFTKGEAVTLRPSGITARYTTTHWFPLYGSYMYIVPFSGVPQPGETITGVSSGATARIDYIMYNDLTLLSDMISYIHTRYPDMKIVTTDQGLDLLGVPKK
ncbi:MAG: polysaccharide deacetylase family protein [Geobacteraceae bacterium]|nr:polysaccharide deacetylase family protein [Geobacteraceae bacterium]